MEVIALCFQVERVRREKDEDLEWCSSASGTFVACCPRDAPEVEFAIPSKLLKGMAGTTGLEPAASAVTGQRSNQLNYVPNLFVFNYLLVHAKPAQDSIAVNSVA